MSNHRFAAVLVLFALFASACGDDSGDAADVEGTDAVVADDVLEDEPVVEDEPVDDDMVEFAYDDPDAYYFVEYLTPEPGGFPETREGAIVLGTQDAYVVDYTNCCTDDTLYANISSVEENAVFTIYGPDGQMKFAETTSANLFLEQGGEFWIVVGSIRGNATYTIDIGLAQNAS